MRYHTWVWVVLLALLGGAALPAGALAQDGGNGPDVAFPVATHYPGSGDGDPAPKHGEVEEVAYGVYNNRLTDYYAPDRGQLLQFVTAVRVAAGMTPLAIYNDFADAVEGSDALQIVNNVPIEGALYTIFLPPGWTRGGNYPVVLSGNGAGISNNRRLYGSLEVLVPAVVGRSVQDGRGGLVAAISNCGGTESQGVDEMTLRSVGAFFDFMAANGGDKHNAVTTGGSRGGGSALVWAANPLDLDYTVRAVFAHVPPTHYGALGMTSILTYPSLGEIAELVGGEGASRFDAGPESMAQRFPAMLDILTGMEDPAEIDATISPVALAERLRGKQIAISEGTHDSFFQLALFLAFDRTLTGLGIDHATAVVLGDGHEMSTWLYSQTVEYLDAVTRGATYTVPNGRVYFIKTPDGQVRLDDFLGAPVAALPFTVELPARSGAGLPIDVSACGAVDETWRITLTGPDGAVAWEQSGVFDETECATFRLATPGAPGVYEWSFTYAGAVVPSTNTPFVGGDGCRVEAVTVVDAQPPLLEARFYRPGHLSFGIDQFAARGADCAE